MMCEAQRPQRISKSHWCTGVAWGGGCCLRVAVFLKYRACEEPVREISFQGGWLCTSHPFPLTICPGSRGSSESTLAPPTCPAEGGSAVQGQARGVCSPPWVPHPHTWRKHRTSRVVMRAGQEHQAWALAPGAVTL